MTASPGDGEHAAREGYYPDPSIPGYVRYWNGAAWVPGTSRPAPAPAPAEETGPVFLDETSATEALPDPAPRTPVRDRADAAPRRAEAEPGGGWQADPVHQAGFGGPRDVRVSWGGPDAGAPGDARPGGISLARPAGAAAPAAAAAPAVAAAAAAPAVSAAAVAPAVPGARRLPAPAGAEGAGILSARAPAWPEAPGTGVSGLTSSWPEATPRAATAPAAAPARPAGPGEGAEAGAGSPAPGRPAAPARGAGPAAEPAGPAPDRAWPGSPDPGPGAARGRAVTPQAPPARGAARPWSEAPAAEPGSGCAGAAAGAGRAPGREWSDAGYGPAPEAGRGARPGPAGGSVAEWAAGREQAPARPLPDTSEADHARAPGAAPGARADARRADGPRPGRQPEAAVPVGTVAHAPSSAALAAAAAERLVREDARAVFERMAERAARPAGLVRRGLARLLDSLVLAGVAVAAALPLVPGVTAHVQAKVDAARASGRTTTVWLLDATTAGRLGLVLAVVLLFGVVYEALPTARWGRTPGKKLCGVRVLATATQRPPGFGAALLRWFSYALLGLPGSLWCLVDRPRRQAWHDKAARTYVTR
ncbi:RDD family protein [Streptomyces sp. NPDC001674]|uniref:RDD family protein n=1 Tax=Streptomyces sp. NPDC001674 TaxID=3154394 RepID=UPI0033314003